VAQKRITMKRNLIISLVVVVIVLVAFLIVKGNKGDDTNDIVVPVESGMFKVQIETTGELEAKNSVPIKGPNSLREFRIYNLTIQDIVDEGTVVNKGQWIATLDKSDFQGRLQDKQIEMDKANSQYVQVQLDTTLQMRQARDELINLNYAVEEQQIILEQSQFEPPATIKQAEINLDKARRALSQARDNNKIKKRQATERMREVAAELRKVQNEYNAMLAVEESFTIKAPEPGMVIYKKGHDGRPIKAGSQISVWDPTVATLPDLAVMISKTYVNEVDVRRIQPGQQVEIGLDAFPEKRLTGRVTRVANVGEQRPNSDAKVFQVTIEINESDDNLRPAMTTSNNIIAKELDSVVFVPLECLHSKDDSISYVYKRQGLAVIKQEVHIGEQNSDDAVVLLGLEQGDRVYLSIPQGKEEAEVVLLPEMDGKRHQEEPKAVVAPNGGERTITLPDGRTMTVPAGSGDGARSGGRRQQQNGTETTRQRGN